MCKEKKIVKSEPYNAASAKLFRVLKAFCKRVNKKGN